MTPCATPVHRERVGLWGLERSSVVLYDGCTVAFTRYVDYGHLWGPDHLALEGAAMIEWLRFGQPHPYYRVAAAWDGDTLIGRSFLGERHFEWDASANALRWHDGRPLHRVESTRALDEAGRRLLCVRRILPTDEELARRLGVLHPPEGFAEDPGYPDEPPTLRQREARAMAAPPSNPNCDPQERFPVRTCEDAIHPERVGVYRSDEGASIVYDGCSIAFRHRLHDEGVRVVGVGGTVSLDFLVYGDPAPYYRGHARWHGNTLLSSAGSTEIPRGIWDAARHTMRDSEGALLRRVEVGEELDEHARRLLCVERIVPTDAELARQLGIRAPPARAAGPIDAVEIERAAMEEPP